MATLTLPSFAKINLALRVLDERDDGFHNLFTIFQTVSLHDTLSFTEADGISLSCDDATLPTDERNLVVKAANILRELYDVRQGAAIHLSKRTPSPGGLGGGSSNAAVAMIGLSRLWDLDIPAQELHPFAAAIGSDVPFFLYGGTAIGTGRGTDIEPVEDIRCPNLLIVTPRVSVPTREAFASMGRESLTSADAERILNVCRFGAQNLDMSHLNLGNDIEAVVFAAHPEVERVKRVLVEFGAANALMSGSGASVFAIFDKEETRQTALKALDAEVNWQKFVVTAVSRAEYRSRLGLAD